MKLEGLTELEFLCQHLRSPLPTLPHRISGFLCPGRGSGNGEDTQ